MTLNSSIRCCAFTCSYKRPLFLRNCIYQLKDQTYSIDHHIFASGISKKYISDIAFKYGTGENKDQHSNHLEALKLIDLDRYDLFFKIDDDDIYKKDYVKNTVESYRDVGWEYSGGHSDGIFLGDSFRSGLMTSLSVDPTEEEIASGVVFYMPSTLVLTRKALNIILNIKETHTYEDITWKNRLWENHLKFHIRDTTNDFYYVVHGKNVSTSGWLLDRGN